MYIQGLGAKYVFQLCLPLPLHFPHHKIQTPGGILAPWHCQHAPVPPSTPQVPCRCYNPEQVSVCQINGKTYWIGTIMQTNEITDQLCPKKSGSACWQYDSGYRVNSPLGPHLYQVLRATHHLFNDANPQLARDCWLCLSFGDPQYLATPVPLNNATAMRTPTNPPLQGPVLRVIELTQKPPECFTNDGGTEPVGNLPRDQCNQTLKSEWPTHPPTNRTCAALIKAFTL